MSTASIILILGGLYFLALLLGRVFAKTGVPDVLFLILLGLLVGPVLKWVEPADFGRVGEVATTLALTVILFESGTTLNLKTLFSSAISAGILTLCTFFTTVLIVCLGAKFLVGMPWGQAVLTGGILGGTSSAVVIPLVKSLKLAEKPATILVMESALTDVLCIVVTVALVDSLLSGQVNLGLVAQSILLSLGVAGALGVLGGLVWLFPCKELRKLPDSQFMTLAFCFVVFGVAELVGVSGAIAVLLFGLTLAQAGEVIKRREVPALTEAEHGIYREIVFVMKVFFFLYLGISFQAPSPELAVAATAAIFLIYLARIPLTRILVKGVSLSDSKSISILVPKGLAAAVLATLPMQRGIAGAETIQGFVFSSVIVSIFLTAVLVPLIRVPPVGDWYSRALGGGSKPVRKMPQKGI